MLLQSFAYIMFQSQNGTIKIYLPVEGKKLEQRFNLKMVRLKSFHVLRL